jgi:hypothetical protein
MFRQVRASLVLVSVVRRSFAAGVDSVVDRCTKKIADSLKPSFLKVLSSNDDPNGSHVSAPFAFSMT